MMKRPTQMAVLVALFMGAMLAAGCSTLPPARQVVLSPPHVKKMTAAPTHWRVMRVKMPEYLDNYDIQVRAQDHVVQHLKNARWAERLPAATTRLLQRTIEEHLQHDRDKTYDVRVEIDTFELQAADRIALSARWQVTDDDRHVVARGSTVIRKHVQDRDDADAIGRAMSQAVHDLGMQIMNGAG